jgi:hypothetical protein
VTLNEWLNSGGASAAAAVLSTGEMQQMMKVLEDERPSRVGYVMGCTPTDVAVAYGRELGYNLAISTLKAMAGRVPVLTHEASVAKVATYENPEDTEI